MARGVMVAASAILLVACSGPTVIGGDVFDLHREAVLAYESGESAKAEALYQGLARAAPNDPETWLRLGNLYARDNKPDDAADAYQHALLIDANNNRVWYNLGVIRQRQAHAALIQANALSRDDDPLRTRTAAMIEKLSTPDTPPAVIDAESKRDAHDAHDAPAK